MAYTKEVRPGVFLVQVSVPHPDPVTGKYKKLSRNVQGGKRAINVAVREMEEEAKDYRYRGDDRPPKNLDEMYEAWLLDLERRKKSPSYIQGARQKFSYIKKDIVGTMRLATITCGKLDAFYGRLAKEPFSLSSSTIGQVHRLLSAAFSYACRQGWIRKWDNPIEDARPPTVYPSEVVQLEIEQVISLMAVARKSRRPEMETVFFLASISGARRGELCGLRINELEAQVLHIKRSVMGATGHVRELAPTKNRRIREVGLDPATMAVLDSHIAGMRQRAIDAGTVLAEDAFLFSDALDGSVPWDPSIVTRQMAAMRKDAGCPNQVFHHLRHFMASKALKMGFSIPTVAGRNGHDPAVLLRIYAHRDLDSDLSLSAALNGLLTENADAYQPRVGSTKLRQSRAGISHRQSVSA